MPANDRERDLQTLRNLIDEAQLVISTIDLPQARTKRAAKLLDSALALTDDLLALPSTAVSLGQRGGQKTAERGSEYFRQIAAKRKTKAGGRPRKSP
ncbi:MAG TPA: hypothetical protein VNU44_09895 [Bryobacteraceae bacterium]|jgi:hypothetical protein|nr:hypothetical protein [Bryobacteraceae bacterium]